MREHVGTVVLDSQGMSAWLAQDRKILAMMQAFHVMGTDVVINANTIVEIGHRRMNVPRLDWALSRIKVEAVTADLAKEAAALLKEVGLHGHKYAIDATVARTALRQRGPVALITPRTSTTCHAFAATASGSSTSETRSGLRSVPHGRGRPPCRRPAAVR